MLLRLKVAWREFVHEVENPTQRLVFYRIYLRLWTGRRCSHTDCHIHWWSLEYPPLSHRRCSVCGWLPRGHSLQLPITSFALGLIRIPVSQAIFLTTIINNPIIYTSLVPARSN